MFLIIAQFVSESFLTMCKACQDLYNQTIYTNKIIGMFHQLIKVFLILEVPHIYS